MQQLLNVIQSSLEQMISFAEFMQIALYDPNAGYYSQNVQIGAKGDFVTAPEIGPLFAYGLAQQFIEVRSRVEKASILEFGAGNGTLAKQLLQHLEALDSLPEHYYILEVSAHLRAKQQEAIASLPKALQARVEWLDKLPAMPISGMVIANEVLDAMPVHVVEFANGGWSECTVSHDGERFVWQTRALSPELSAELRRVLPEGFEAEIPEPYRLELNLNCAPWLQSVSEVLSDGLCLLIDYGFARDELYIPQRCQGTIMCHTQQKTHPDPLIDVGMQDITAHVDFTSVAEAAVDAGMNVDGFSEQGHFLLSLGILDCAESFEDKQAIKVLTLPHEMGALFKVMGLSKGESHFWRGFEMNDKRGRL